VSTKKQNNKGQDSEKSFSAHALHESHKSKSSHVLHRPMSME